MSRPATRSSEGATSEAHCAVWAASHKSTAAKALKRRNKAIAPYGLGIGLGSLQKTPPMAGFCHSAGGSRRLI